MPVACSEMYYLLRYIPEATVRLLDEVLRRDALVLHYAANGFSKHAAYAKFLYLGTLTTIWNAVSKYHFGKS